MSYDLFVFKGPTPRSEVEFTALLDRFQAGDEAAFESSPKLKAFYEDLLRKYPALESERLIALTFAWPEAERAAKEVPKLTRKHGLVVMDPQSGLIVRP